MSADANQTLDLAQRLQEHLDRQNDDKADDKPKVKKGVQGSLTTGLLGEKVGRMRKKVKAIARMARMFKTLREENQMIIRLKGVCPGHKIPAGVLLEGKDRIRSEC